MQHEHDDEQADMRTPLQFYADSIAAACRRVIPVARIRRLARIKAEIQQHRYETPDKLEVAADRLHREVFSDGT